MAAASIARIPDTCIAQQKLLASYIIGLKLYNQTYLSLMHEVGVDEATRRIVEIYRTCVDSRKSLRQHELEHGCEVEWKCSASQSPAVKRATLVRSAAVDSLR